MAAEGERKKEKIDAGKLYLLNDSTNEAGCLGRVETKGELTLS